MDVLQQANELFLDVYNRFPVELDKGKGAYLYDKSGRCYLDFLSGIAVNALGYGHPAIIEAIQNQAYRNLHLSNFFIQDIQVEFASKLLSLTPFSKLFLTNSGTEAIEGLLKLVKKWGKQNNKKEIISFEGSFHGRSLGALSITNQEKYQKNFLPLLSDIVVVPFNQPEKLRDAISVKTAAVFYEGITGEGGVRPVSDEVYEVLSELRKRYTFLLIADEIQTGAGRTGRFYYFEHKTVVPDAIASAKGLGGGLPLGAFLVSKSLENIFDKGEHGTTYGGNPLACATGLAAINIISENMFLKNVEKQGTYFKSKLYDIANEFSDIALDVRGEGLMLGLEVRGHSKEIMSEAFNQGLIFNIAGGNTLRFIPPLIINETLVDEACEKLRMTFKKLFR